MLIDSAGIKYHILCQYKQAVIVLSCPRMRNISVKAVQLLININSNPLWCASLLLAVLFKLLQ